jgi:hypothetical protein
MRWVQLANPGQSKRYGPGLGEKIGRGRIFSRLWHQLKLQTEGVIGDRHQRKQIPVSSQEMERDYGAVSWTSIHAELLTLLI